MNHWLYFVPPAAFSVTPTWESAICSTALAVGAFFRASFDADPVWPLFRYRR